MIDNDTPYLCTQLKTKYGPTAFLGRALFELEAALRIRGVALSLVSMETLLDINKREADGWAPLVPIFDPTFNELDDTNAFAIIGRNGKGEVVATQAARLFDWRTTTFKEAAEGMWMFYSNPDRYRLPDETCTVTALAAQAITGRFVFSGAAWNHPSLRRSGLVQLLPRISRAYAFTTWNPEVVGTVMSKSLVERGVHERVGYGNFEWGLELRGSRLGDMDLSLQWIKANEIVPDLKRVLIALKDCRSNGELHILGDREQHA